jgi:hypothetical protein
MSAGMADGEYLHHRRSPIWRTIWAWHRIARGGPEISGVAGIVVHRNKFPVVDMR